MHLKQIACVLALLATGCTAAPTAVAPLPANAPVRKVLSAESAPARMWALRYNGTTMALDTTTRSLEDCYARNTPFEMHTYGPSYTWCYSYTDLSVKYDHTGPGQFESIGHHAQNMSTDALFEERFLYTVPDGQVLVVNHIGGGSLTINGFKVAADRDVEYRFGGGEIVIFTLQAGGWAEGYVADEAMFTGSSPSRNNAK